MNYTIKGEQAHQQFFQITFEADVMQDETILVFPNWRPGRYQLANFAKNIKLFKVNDGKGKALKHDKIDLNKWWVDTKNAHKIVVSYSYYANELNAGSTFLDSNYWYVNPINCCIYIQDLIETPCTLKLVGLPEHYTIACSKTFVSNSAQFKSFHELADTPFISSNQLQCKSYKVKETSFYIWFHGEIRVEWDKILKDFKKFTEKQVKEFKEFPGEHFHFLIHILPYPAYHGVEHLESTVITLGPTYKIFGDLYKELLGVSSHEIYHCWNVKSIRPSEWLPYDYSTSFPSEMGYLAEGVTTYMGDMMLYRSGVFDFEQIAKELANRIQQHLYNFGRLNYSLTSSSYDTWLDGYEPGVPGRKVSIYNEGALLALYTDIWIMQQTANTKGLQDIIRRMYFDYAVKGAGITEKIYIDIISLVAGKDFQPVFDIYFNKNQSYESIIMEVLEYLGIELITKPNPDKTKSLLGIIGIPSNNGGFTIKRIFPGSTSDLAGLRENDTIISLNNKILKGNIQEWLTYYEYDEIHLTIERSENTLLVTCPNIEKGYFYEYELKSLSKPDKNQEFAFRKWSK